MNPPHPTAIVGAGPVGCLAAISLARAGNPVTVFEANPGGRRRFAGEWLHPSGVRALERAGVLSDNDSSALGMLHQGFAIFPDDRSEPVLLEYPEGDQGLVFEHGLLLERLRERAVSQDGVRFLSGARVCRVEAGQVEFQQGDSKEIKTHAAARIVGADGRGSIVRPALRLPRSSKLISYMVGIMMKDVELPYEGYGHVILGAPGPILLYRVAPNQVRVSIDVPVESGSGADHWKELLREEYLPFFPESLRDGFAHAVGSEPIQFRANRYRARLEYGNENLTLVGDAVGFQHPLTAMGMTLGFQDAEGLANAETFEEFCRKRRAVTLVPEMLAMTLYQAFSGRDPGAREVRKAIYSMWRKYPKERERTMRLLAGEITSPVGFSISFLRGVKLALWGSVDADLLRFQWGALSRTVGSIAQLLQEAALCSSSRIGRVYPGVPLVSRG